MWHQENKDIKEWERRQSDDKHKITCTGGDKLNDTEEDREKNSKELAYKKAERDVINQNPVNKCTADEVQELKFQVNCLHYSSVTFIEQIKVLV